MRHKMITLLNAVDQAQLINFMLDYAERDATFLNMINVKFSQLDFDEEITKMKAKIHAEFYGVQDYDSRRDSWGNFQYCTDEIHYEINQRCEQGHVKLAFIQLAMLYEHLVSLFEYQGECEFGEEAEYTCLGGMKDIAELVQSPEDKKKLQSICQELLNLENIKGYGYDHLNDIVAEIIEKLN